MSDGKVRAWTEAVCGHDGVRVAYVGVPPESEIPLTREPATRQFASLDEARSWVEEEARALGVGVEWGAEAPHQTFD